MRESVSLSHCLELHTCWDRDRVRQGWLVSNHIEGKADVTCTAEAATQHEDGPSVLKRTHAGTHDLGYDGRRSSCVRDSRDSHRSELPDAVVFESQPVKSSPIATVPTQCQMMIPGNSSRASPSFPSRTLEHTKSSQQLSKKSQHSRISLALVLPRVAQMLGSSPSPTGHVQDTTACVRTCRLQHLMMQVSS